MSGLIDKPTRYEFFQATRLLERGDVEGAHGRAVGTDNGPRQEVVRFRGSPSLAFPATAIRSVKRRRSPIAGDAKAVEMTVGFEGALGACGVLPWHYSEQVFDRLSKRDHSLLDFVDALQHRSIAFRFRAWKKYRLPFAYESAARQPGVDDVTTMLRALVGVPSEAVAKRPAEGVDRWVYFASQFAREQRTADGIRAILSELCACRVNVREFVGRWQTLVREECSRLGGRADPQDLFRNQLGGSLVLGDRIWDVSAGIRIRIGPIHAEKVRELAPRTGGMPWLASLIRSYLRSDVDFDVVCEVDPATVSPARLGGDVARLGESLWLCARDKQRYDTSVPLCMDNSSPH